MKRVKRAISILMCAALLLGLLPTLALAEESGEPGNNQYRVIYNECSEGDPATQQAFVKIVEATIPNGAVQSFTTSNAITFTLQPKDGETATPIVEIEVFGENGMWYSSEWEENHLQITNGQDGTFTVSFTPSSDNPFEVRVFWSAKDRYDTFGFIENEEVQLIYRVLGNVDVTFAFNDNDRGHVSYYDDGNGYDWHKQNLTSSTQSITVTLVPRDGFVLDKVELGEDTVSVTNNQFTWNSSDFGKELKVEFKDPNNSGGGESGEGDPTPQNGVQFQLHGPERGDVIYKIGNDTGFTQVTNTGDGSSDVNSDVTTLDADSTVTFKVQPEQTNGYFEVHINSSDPNENVLDALNAANNGNFMAVLEAGDSVSFTARAGVGYSIRVDFGQNPINWHTVSWSGGNVTVENGEVLAERVHVAANGNEPAKTYTVIESEYNASEDDYVFSLWDTIGKEKENEEDSDSLQLYGLGFSQSDLFIANDLEGVSIDFKFVPDYGYQLSDILTNEENSLLRDFTASPSEISTFNFVVLPDGGNVHFNVVFALSADEVASSTAKVSAGSIANGQNAADSGNLKLAVADMAEEDKTAFGYTPQAGETALYLDLKLSQVVSKGGDNGNWTTEISEFEQPITVTLNVGAQPGDTYYVMRKHADGTPERIAAVNNGDGTISFQTNRFSDYMLVQEAANPPVYDDVYDDTPSAPSGSTDSGTTTETTNPDGSTTTTVTDKTTGSVTETTTTQPVTDEAGNTTQTVTETVTNKDGSTVETVTETVQGADGSTIETKTEVKTDADGAATTTETVTATDATGTTAEKVTETNAAGETTTTVAATLSDQAVTQAAASGAPVTLPVEVAATKDAGTAPVVSVEVPASVSAEAPAKVEIPVENTTPGTVAVLVHADGTEEIIKTSVPGENGVVLTLDGSTTVKIVENSKTYDDVQTSDWHSDAVDFVSSRELFQGNGDGTFTPEVSMTRGMLSQVLYNLENNPGVAVTDSFPDVAEGAWYAEAVCWAADKGIVTGYGGGAFGAEDSITREQLATMLWRYAGSPVTTSDVSRFPDAGRISSYADTAMRWAVENGIMQGDGTGLNPTGSASRAESAQMLMNFMSKQKP